MVDALAAAFVRRRLDPLATDEEAVGVRQGHDNVARQGHDLILPQGSPVGARMPGPRSAFAP